MNLGSRSDNGVAGDMSGSTPFSRRTPRPTLLRSVFPLGVALLLAGCASTPGGEPVVPPSSGWELDCSLGAYETSPGWQQTCMAHASHTPGSKTEMWIAINPKNADNVVIGSKDMRPESSAKCVWNGLAVTHDGGKTWKDVVIGGNYADRKPTDPWFGYACNTDPMFQFTSDGELHYGIEMYNFLGRDAFGQFNNTPLKGNEAEKTPGWKILLATSRDGGLTWPQVITWMPDTGPIPDDYSRMVINPKTQSIIEGINLFAPTGTTCNLLVSRDGGKTADPPKQPLGPNAQNTRGMNCALVAAAPDGTVVLGTEGPGLTYWTISKDDARTFGAPIPSFSFKPVRGTFNGTKFRAGTNFEAAYDLSEGPRKGTLYTAYADSSRDEADIYVRFSKDHGATWSDASRVNQEPAGTHQWLPNIAVAGDGSVHLFYHDQQYDPEHHLIDVTHAVSLDGGLTWANTRVTNVSWEGDLGLHQRGFPFIGDYLGIAAFGDHVWGAFPDASDGRPPIIAAAHVRLEQGGAEPNASR